MTYRRGVGGAGPPPGVAERPPIGCRRGTAAGGHVVMLWLHQTGAGRCRGARLGSAAGAVLPRGDSDEGLLEGPRVALGKAWARGWGGEKWW